jgi:hypothetical protein
MNIIISRVTNRLAKKYIKLTLYSNAEEQDRI